MFYKNLLITKSHSSVKMEKVVDWTLAFGIVWQDQQILITEKKIWIFF